MSILKEVRQSLNSVEDCHESLGQALNELENDEALKEASRLADLFEEIKPQPYAIPLQRFAGIPVMSQDKQK